MPKKKSTKLKAGTQILVNPGVSIPECPEICAEGWTGTVVETKGRGETLKYIVEWEESTLENMPKNYIEQCESNGLYHRMACLNADQIQELEKE